MISINQAVTIAAQATPKGLAHIRLRRPIWAHPMDHLEVTLVDGLRTPWIKLWAPFNKECNKRDPVELLQVGKADAFDLDAVEFEPYEGPLPESDEYKAEVAKFEELFNP